MEQTRNNLKIIREQLGREISKNIMSGNKIWFINIRKSAESLDVAIKELEKKE